VGGEDCAVAFGPNASTMMFHTSRALARQWKEGDEIILTEMDHHSNIDTWRLAAQDKNVAVKYIPLNPEMLTLDLDALPGLISPKTRLIALGMASNCIGTITDLRPVVKLAKSVGALVAADAVHAAAHFYADMQGIGFDILFCSAYKFFASHMGMAIIRKEVFEGLEVYKLTPAPDSIPERLEIGTQNHEGIPAISAAVEFIESLGSGKTQKERIISGYKAMEDHENLLAETIRQGLRRIDGITLYQADSSVAKTPTIAFRAKGITTSEFCARIGREQSIFLGDGHFYAMTVAKKLGVLEDGSFIRAGMAPYNTMEEVSRFLSATAAIMNSIN